MQEVLREAVETIDGLELPQDLRAVAFGKAVDLIVSNHVTAPAVNSKQDRESSNHERSTQTSPLLQQIVNRSRLDLSVLEDIYSESEGEIHVIVNPNKLDKGKKAGTRQLALLVSFGRQMSGLEEWTSLEVIRKIAEDYKRYDQPNFARTISEMSNTFSVSGTSRDRTVKLSRPGREEGIELIKALSGESD